MRAQTRAMGGRLEGGHDSVCLANDSVCLAKAKRIAWPVVSSKAGF